MTAPAVSAIRVGLFSVGAGGAAIAGSGHDPRTSPLYSSLADAVGMPLLRSIDAEDAHNFTIRLLEAGLAPVDPLRGARGVLRTSVWGLGFSSPLGLAAGFDKQGRALAPLLRMGLGYVEVGGITPLPQPGNPRPRMFRLPEDKAVINRFGLNSEGAAAVAARLEAFQQRRGAADEEGAGAATGSGGGGGLAGVVGVNLAKNTASDDAAGDFVKVVEAVGPHVDVLVLNVSCPNVSWTSKLSGDAGALEKLVRAVKAARDALPPRKTSLTVGGEQGVAASFRPPLLLKVGPDMDGPGRAHMAHLAVDCGVDGLVVSNTTNDRFDGKALPAAAGGVVAGSTIDMGGGGRDGGGSEAQQWVQPSLKSKDAGERGGLSGAPVKGKALATLRDMYQLTGGRVPLVGVGGISSGADAYERIRAGASLVQVYTALAYEGPGLARRINDDLAALLAKDGFTSVADAVGVDNPIRPQTKK
jgi:dihydroorotate dehydrogenase